MSIKWNYTDTAGVTVGSLTPAAINFSSDFAKKSQDGTSLTLTNITSPLNCPETIRFSQQRVANVYTGSGADPSAYAPNKSGSSILVQVNDFVRYSGDQGITYDLPVSAHLVLKVPHHEAIDQAVIQTMIERLIGACYEQGGSSVSARLNNLIRGAVTPKVLV